VVIASPATYRDVLQEQIAEIHRTVVWPVVVAVDGNISIPVNTDFIDRDGSYIIIIPDGNIESIDAEITGQIFYRKNEISKLWNSVARFVVAEANEFSMSQQKYIFDYFSKYRIYKFIIVSKELDVIMKEYSRTKKVNNVGTGI